MMSSTLASTFTAIDRSRPASAKREVTRTSARFANAAMERKTELLTVPQLLEVQAALSPDALALSSLNGVLTYGQLNEAANQLAHYLRSHGVGTEDRVGICLDRSVTAVISALAVFKAGAAYLPIDPAYPRERIGFMLMDANPRVLITTSAIAQQVHSGAWEVITVEELGYDLQAQQTSAPAVEIAPEHLAYVIYTSGSTGHPKGVQITHAKSHEPGHLASTGFPDLQRR